MNSAPCPKCRWPIETWDRAHKNRECIANLSADVEAHGQRIDALEHKLEAAGKVIAWWNECKRFEDGKVEP